MIPSEVLAKIKSGAKVKVWERISAEGATLAVGQGSASRGKEGGKERESAFAGLVIARKHGSEAGATFTVRATISGVGVEKVYPIHSPMIGRIEIISFPKKVSKSKLYYVRDLSVKKLREKLKD